MHQEFLCCIYWRRRGHFFVGCLLVRLHIHRPVLLGLTSSEIVSAGLVNFPDNREDQEKNIQDHVCSDEVEDKVSQIVAGVSVWDVVREQEHRPDADQHDQLVQDLQDVDPSVHHRPLRDEVNQEQGA